MDSGTIVLPRSEVTPFRSAGRRLAVAIGVLVTMATVVWFDGDGYSDVDGSITWFDALYYATVSASTTGYGDIAPASDQARLVNILFVTPARIVFVVALIGSAFEVVTTTTRELFRRRHYKRVLHGHTVVIGYGTRGRAAVRALLESGHERELIVAIDGDEAAAAEAVEAGLTAVQGDATRDAVQAAAFVEEAAQVLVAVSQDATSVLATLTTRRLNPKTRIVASVREADNAPLLHDSGANSVVVTSETAGRLLGLAVARPPAAALLGDLLEPASSLALVERDVLPHEVGGSLRASSDLVLAVVRDGRRTAFYDETVGLLQTGDRVVVVHRRTE